MSCFLKNGRTLLFLTVSLLLILAPPIKWIPCVSARCHAAEIEISDRPVNDPIVARNIVKRTIEILYKKGFKIKTPMDRITVELRNLDQMRELAHTGQPGGHHRTRTVKQGEVTWVSDCTISLLRGQREDVMMGVAAHELFHLWQSERDASNGWIRWIEGSANVAKYLVLKDIDNDETRRIIQRMMEDKDPVYGKGFRKALEYYEKHGMKKYRDKVYKECGGKPRKNRR